METFAWLFGSFVFSRNGLSSSKKEYPYEIQFSTLKNTYDEKSNTMPFDFHIIDKNEELILYSFLSPFP